MFSCYTNYSWSSKWNYSIYLCLLNNLRSKVFFNLKANSFLRHFSFTAVRVGIITCLRKRWETGSTGLHLTVNRFFIQGSFHSQKDGQQLNIHQCVQWGSLLTHIKSLWKPSWLFNGKKSGLFNVLNSYSFAPRNFCSKSALFQASSHC